MSSTDTPSWSGSGSVRDRLAAALAAAGVAWSEVDAYEELDGGTFNTVFRVRSSVRAGLVVKLAPGADVPVLRYEEGILGTEAWFYGMVRDRAPEVPCPVAPAPAADGHLVMSECAGRPWPDLADELDDSERRALRAELGRHVAALHALKGDGFGYPARPLLSTWRDAFLGMVDAILLDAGRFDVPLPRPADEIRALFAAQGGLLDEVTVPRLVHFDLWDGNILVEEGRISALIDAERAFWGDPLAEFVSLALFGDIERDADFLAGYREAGGPAVIDEGGRRRLALYQAYLHLIMWVEAVPRRFDAGRIDWLRRRVVEPLGAMLDEWAGR
ncbi:aminoglycoside phosphotransferase family protein [Streptomyces kunmingensis]|uniref:Aminoglycoside phosphotransferase family protein n=1 Tax=Streptomyces kunmingensis TaxID=68225 RepID=A0ABU6CEG7_9ACTN|nr:aminoglycoside phosphotransferase family protein [Streptomyces kunmingensis]MEB3962255.1 aminoglycoside phosphotransferase family protein [Streptomyces kunmingensis]